MPRKMAGGGSALAAAYLATELCGLLRIVLFAHVLAPASMGALVILGTWLRLVEMATDLSVDRYLLREADGASRRVQNAAHGAGLLRGIAGSAVMLASLWPLLAVYQLQDKAPAFAAVALVPLIRGVTHLDYRLMNRFFRLKPTIVVELGSAFAGLAVATAGAVVMPGAEAFAATLLMQAVAAVVLSHACASRGYALAFDRALARRFWHFGWPLTVNALFLYAVFQGERMLVGGIISLETLGTYAIAAQLALLPVMITGRLSLSLALPLLARKNGTAETARGSANVTAAFAVAGLFFWLGFVLVAPPVITVLLGAAYLPSAADMSWIAAAAAIRMQKTGPATVLLAASRTRDILAGSSARLAGLACGTAAMALTLDLTMFLAIAALSEAVSYAIIAKRSGTRIPMMLAAPLSVLALAAAQCAWPFSLVPVIPVFAVVAAAGVFALARHAARSFPITSVPRINS